VKEVIVSSIRALRRSNGLTLIDLALRTDIPARTLAEIEYGFQRLDYESRSRLARFFEIHPDLLASGATHRMRRAGGASTGRWWRIAAARGAPLVVAAAFVGAQLATTPAQQLAPAASVPIRQPTAAPTAQPPAAIQLPHAFLQAIAAPVRAARAAPTALPVAIPAPPRFALLEDGPHGCPIGPVAGQVVLTQGYGVGTHAPANAWGAVDLAIDGDGDGVAEPGASWGAPVLASLGGVARVFMGSWPGGNFVRIVDERTGWSVAYGHLDTVAVADGQQIEAGATIGTIGSTGMASGPHLHYEVWHGDANVDPTGLVGCA
jgi:murein DD-endopeptidase MepM/ murein hydrolase activator NlpD